MEITEILMIVTTIIGSARLIFKGLQGLTKLTKTEKDDRIVAKGLRAIRDIAEIFGIPESNSDLKVKVNK